MPVTDEVRRLLGPPRKSGCCFSTLPDASKPIQGFGKWKAKLDTEISAMRKKQKRKPMPSWELSRDIRRTQMTMIMDLKIPRHIGDRVQGRTIDGATVTYDRSDYAEQKHEALETVAAHLAEILKGKQSTEQPLVDSECRGGRGYSALLTRGNKTKERFPYG